MPVLGLAQPFAGALCKKAADQTTANYTAGAAIAWDSETGGYDTHSIHDNVTANTVFTIPSGFTKAKIKVTLRASSMTADTWSLLYIRKNGSGDFVGNGQMLAEAGATAMYIECETAWVDVVAGNTFDAFYQTESDTSITIEEEGTSFAIELRN